jgi:hypothetical protein
VTAKVRSSSEDSNSGAPHEGTQAADATRLLETRKRLRKLIRVQMVGVCLVFLSPIVGAVVRPVIDAPESGLIVMVVAALALGYSLTEVLGANAALDR